MKGIARIGHLCRLLSRRCKRL